MPELPHLILPKAEVELERRKRPGFGEKITKDVKQQTERVRQAVDEALAVHKKLRANATDPKLIVRVRTSSLVSDDEWLKAGLDVLGHDANDAVVLFSSDAELTEFRRRLDAYATGVPEGQENPSYNLLIASIEEFGPLKPEDRIGSGLREEGFTRLDNFAADRDFVLDVELWDFGSQDDRVREADQLDAQITERGGTIPQGRKG